MKELWEFITELSSYLFRGLLLLLLCLSILALNGYLWAIMLRGVLGVGCP